MNVVSFGGGTNSTAMIIGMYLHKIPIDLILFADTGGEQPHTYEFMETFNEWLVKHGIPKIVSVEYHDKDGNRLTLEQECINSGRLPSIAYASNPMWYQGGDNKNGESKLAKQSFFHTDGTFKIAEYMHFCNRLLKKEPKEKGQAPAMIVFCAFEQMQTVIEYGKRYGFAKSYPLFFCKNYSAQVLKANMKIVGATEFAVVLYRDKLPKFRNVGEDGGKHMVFDWFRWERDSRKEYPKIHPTQKPVGVLKRLIEVFTDPGDVVIDPVAGSGTTLRAAYELGRSAYGFEVDKSFYEAAREKMLAPILTETTTI